MFGRIILTILVDKVKNPSNTGRPKLDGLHHVTAVTADPGRCSRFYRGVLGLDRIEPTLGYESNLRERLCFGDSLGRPGGILTMLVCPGADCGRLGRGSVARVAWRVADAGALRFWGERFAAEGVAAEMVTGPEAGAPPAIRFSDPEGLGHELVVDESGDEPLGGDTGDIPASVALRGLDGVIAYGGDVVASSDLLAGRLDFATEGPRAFRLEGRRRRARYALESAPPGRRAFGAGTVHHVAWACEAGELPIWRQRVIGLGSRATPIASHGYFDCFYFREPSGVLFEIATRGATRPRAEGVPRTEELEPGGFVVPAVVPN
jgi:glyoxalase family protein